MEKEVDEYCEKIFIAIAVDDEKIRFNELHRKLTKLNAKMSKPTLIEHLNHLVENGIIQRNQEDKQRVSYELNWEKFKQLQTAKKINQATLNQMKSEKEFKSMSLDQQVTLITVMLTISELLYLKLSVLDILEPENKLQNYFSYKFIRNLYYIYARWLLSYCKKSKENSQKILYLIDKEITMFRKTLFETNQEATQP